MTNYPIVRFVDEVGSFTPRVGLNEDDLVVLHDGFTLGAPTLEVDDPFAVGVELGSRKVEGTLRVRGDGESAAMYLQAFAREVLRTSSVLMFQFDPGSEPVWLRTYLSEPQALDFANAVAGATRGETTFTLPWSLTADPFACGVPETITATVTNSPLVGTNAALVVLPEIKGDAPTPLSFSITGAASALPTVNRPLLALTAVDPSSPYAGWLVTPSGAVGSTTSDTSFLGGSCVSASSTSWSKVYEATVTVVEPGRFRVFTRIAGTGTFAVRIGTQAASGIGSVAYADEVIVDGNSTTSGVWREIGVATLPQGGFIPPGGGSVLVTVEVQRRTDSGTLRVSSRMAAMLVIGEAVASATTMTVAALPSSEASVTTVDVTKDPYRSSLLLTDGSVPAGAPAVTGAPLMAVPGHANVLHVLPSQGGALGGTAAFTFTYYPRLIWLNAGL